MPAWIRSTPTIASANSSAGRCPIDRRGKRQAALPGAEHRQFDFWIGEWDVRDPQGKLVGRNRIEEAHDGCVLIEHWTSASRVTGTSLKIYDRDRGKWHQTWVDGGGGLLQLDGGLLGNAMALKGEAVDTDAPAKIAIQRITWTPQANGDVRQLWESSTGQRKNVERRFRRQIREADVSASSAVLAERR